ncbi:SGNH/GDSL hydrolase family protein [Sphingobacterium griseoflavum]|nr:SGNH/GDSL hydrolase family protein [Sphingobacterium griseoflavum]
MTRNRMIKAFVVLCFIMTCGFIAEQDRPTLFVIGDSTVKSGRGDGSDGQWGWGSFIGDHLDTSAIRMENCALGGTSSRTFYNNPKLWQQVLDHVKPGDYVIMQFGHNDASPIVDTLRARGTIKGNGEGYKEVYNPLLKQKEMVYSYGFYLRRFVKNVQDKGATAIVCSPIPRHAWDGEKVKRSDYATWAEEAAQQAAACFVPLQDLVIDHYEQVGKVVVAAKYFGPKDGTHTTQAGAQLNATLLVGYLADSPRLGLHKFLKR